MRSFSKFWILVLAVFVNSVFSARYNAYGLKLYTTESEHFRIHYQDGTGHLAAKIAERFEELYKIYRDGYGLTLPQKTEVVLQDGDESNGLAFANLNFIVLWTHDFDFNLRGNHDYFDDVVAHEFAHIVSISASFKTAPWIPYIQIGKFDHPNQKYQTEAMHILSMDILPPWFTEGIAQYESSRNKGDCWDTHRDMILRSLTLGNKLLSWDHMHVFTGKGDDFEKTYNQGFSLVKYISEKYGYNKIPSILRECSKITRFDFDYSLKSVLGIPARQLYKEWAQSLKDRYTKQIDSIGPQVYGKKLNKYGYENYWPKFSPDGSKVYFLSNQKADYGYKTLLSYSFSDTIKDTNKIIRSEMNIRGFYNINPATRKICFVSSKSRKSILPSQKGGIPSLDVFIDTLPPDNGKFNFGSEKHQHQVTTHEGIFGAVFSPSGNRLAGIKRVYDRCYLVLIDTSGKVVKKIYPDTTSANKFDLAYSLSWSPDGHHIALSYFDNKARRIGIYDTLNHSFEVLYNDNSHDYRDPVYSRDGKYLYFSSDISGVFNIYRYSLVNRTIEKLTNVSGGAFAPDVSPDGKKLVYTGYGPEGYGIYYLDTLKVLKKIDGDSAFVPRKPVFEQKPSVVLTSPRPYSRLPRQLLLMPTILAEQVVTNDNNSFVGQTALKAGAIFNLMDPFSWTGIGTELNGYFLLDTKHYLDFIQLDKGGLNPKANFDLGLSGVTRTLPVTLSFDYSLRSIAAENSFYDEYLDTNAVLPYNERLHDFNFIITHDFNAGKDILDNTIDGVSVGMIASMNFYDIDLDLDLYNQGVFGYNLSKGFRYGCIGTYASVARNSKSNISPRGTVAKLQFDIWNQYSLNEDNAFASNTQLLKENYDTYSFLEVTGHMKSGIHAPWYDKNDIHLDMRGSYVKEFDQSKNIPSFFLPVALVPGYTYYYRTVKPDRKDPTKMVDFDTVLVTGNAVLSGELSYRFPLWPKLIDKKIWFLYLEYLYGCVNVSGGAGWMKPEDFFKFQRQDWLLSYGAELRLEAQTFNQYPLAVKFRWDRGVDRRAPLGGDRYSISIGFDFDNWGLVTLPDYSYPGKLNLK